MYKLLIVEDDVFYRYEIRNFLEWEEYGFTVVGEAVNGKAALPLLEELQPDLVLTDISMPEMNGIELIKILRRDYPNIMCIVLSSYDDFNFVKDAMKLGARDYILKYDLKKPDVAGILEQVKNEIEMSRKEQEKKQFLADNLSVVSDEILKKLLLGETDLEEFFRFWRSTGRQEKPANVTVLIVRFSEEEQTDFRKARKILETFVQSGELVTFMDEYTIAMLLSMARERSALRILEYVARKVSSLYQQFQESDISGFTIGVSDASTDLNQLSNLYRQADIAWTQSMYEGEEKVYFYANVSIEQEYIDLENVAEKLTEEIHEGQLESARRHLEDTMAYLHRIRPGKKILQQTFFLLAHVFYRTSIEEKIPLESILGVSVVSEKWVSNFHTLPQMEKALLDAFDNLVQKLEQKEQIAYNGGSRQAAAIMNYIEKNYMKELSLEILSEKMGLTPNYLCKVFKNSTGIKLTQYINRVRIEGAKKLLRQSNMRANEIAETVGFASASYFSTIFKQVTGMTVSEYKDNIF